jgi:hypothetical protein
MSTKMHDAVIPAQTAAFLRIGRGSLTVSRGLAKSLLT